MAPDIDTLSSAVATWPERARAVVVVDQESYANAAVLLREIKALRGEIEETFGPIIAKAHAAHREACAQRKKHEAPLELAETTIKRLMGGYVEAEERRAREEQARQERAAREAEAKRQAELRAAEEATRLAEAEALEQAGMEAEALAVLAAPMPEPEPALPPPPPMVAAVPRAEGVSVRETWTAEVTDLAALVRAVAEGKAPVTLLRVDPTALGQYARATRGAVPVPGVRFVAQKSVAARAS